MAKLTKDKEKITITIDKNVAKQLKGSNFKVSTLINNLLKQHLSLYSNHFSMNTHNPAAKSC